MGPQNTALGYIPGMGGFREGRESEPRILQDLGRRHEGRVFNVQYVDTELAHFRTDVCSG